MDTTSQKAALRQTIHDTTRALHERLDHDVLSERVVSPKATLEDYRRFLIRNLGFLIPMEQELRSGVDVSYASDRSQRIISDLVYLGMHRESIDALPILAQEDPPSTIGYALGMRYVIEGSAVGGLVIAKQVQKHLGLKPDQMSFLLPDQPKTVLQNFHRFLEVMESQADCDTRRGQALLGANNTFQRIVEWFESNEEY